MKLKVSYTDGRTVEINAGPKAQVAFERKFDLPLTSLERVEHLYYVAHIALHFAGLEEKDFDDFLGRIDAVEQAAGASEPDPTRPARRRKASSGSA